MFISSIVFGYLGFEHNLGGLSRFVLSLSVMVEARIVLKMFLFGPKIEARCSYKIVIIKKACMWFSS